MNLMKCATLVWIFASAMAWTGATFAAEPPDIKVSPNGEVAAVANLQVKPGSQALFAMFGRDLSAPPALHFAADLKPVTRSKPSRTDPKSLAECR